MKDLEKVHKNERRDRTIVTVGDIRVGIDCLIVAGPCAVESDKQIITIAKEVKKAGANLLRGNIYKPRTSPYSFSGVQAKGLRYLNEVKLQTGLPIVTEVLDIRDIEKVIEYCDVIQVGSRNMQNYSLLREVGKIDKPVILKRGFMATIHEWLCSAEYILLEGNKNIILCERGIRTFETYTRNTLDLSSVAALKELTHLPVISDPSHGTGKRGLILPLCLSSIMAGSDGVMMEVHTDPNMSVSDANQTISLEKFYDVADKVKKTWEFRQSISNCLI